MDQLIRPIFYEKCKDTTIIDGLHLINALEKQQQRGSLRSTTLFCTFDIHNLYSMLPQDQALDILIKFLQSHGYAKIDHIDLVTIKQLASIVLKENVFVYNKKFYKQTTGGAMGSSFTLTLANIFMWHWQKEFVRQQTISGEYFGRYVIPIHSLARINHRPRETLFPSLYFRYIDDVFMTWNRSKAELINLLRNANQWHPNIKLDYKIGKSLPFLDVLLTNNHGLLSTCVYHKPSAEPYVVPFASDHPKHIFGNIIQTSLKRAIQYSSILQIFL